MRRGPGSRKGNFTPPAPRVRLGAWYTQWEQTNLPWSPPDSAAFLEATALSPSYRSIAGTVLRRLETGAPIVKNNPFWAVLKKINAWAVENHRLPVIRPCALRPAADQDARELYRRFVHEFFEARRLAWRSRKTYGGVIARVLADCDWRMPSSVDQVAEVLRRRYPNSPCAPCVCRVFGGYLETLGLSSPFADFQAIWGKPAKPAVIEWLPEQELHDLSAATRRALDAFANRPEAQDVILAAAERIASGRLKTKDCRTYLLTVGMKTIGRASRPFEGTIEWDDGTLKDLPSLRERNLGPIRVLVREALEASSRLPEEQRDVLLLTAAGGTVEQISEALDVCSQTVRSRLSSARNKMRAWASTGDVAQEPPVAPAFTAPLAAFFQGWPR